MNSDDLKKKKKVKALKDAENSALKNAAIAAGNETARTMGEATKDRDAAQEKAVAEKYKDVPVSPIYSKGVFTSASKYNDSNKITEDDKTQEKPKKKKKK